MADELIKSIQSFIELEVKEKGIIELLFEEKSIKNGDFFLAEGQVCKYAGFIIQGLMRYYINHEGEDRTYEFAQENSFICNYESLFLECLR